MAHLKVYDFHLVRFGEAIEKLREHLDRRNVYLYNPAIEA